MTDLCRCHSFYPTLVCVAEAPGLWLLDSGHSAVSSSRSTQTLIFSTSVSLRKHISSDSELKTQATSRENRKKHTIKPSHCFRCNKPDRKPPLTNIRFNVYYLVSKKIIQPAPGLSLTRAAPSLQNGVETETLSSSSSLLFFFVLAPLVLK